MELQEADVETWMAFLESHPEAHVLQTALWGDLKTSFGWRARRWLLKEHDKPRAGLQVLIRPLPLDFSVLYIPKGPVGDWQHPEVFRALLAALDRLARETHALWLRIEPDVLEGELLLDLTVFGFRPAPSIQPRRTILVSLEGEEEAILQAMHPKTRYNIRLAQRKGVQVREAQLEDLPLFYQLLRQTATRDRFAIHTFDYYRAAYERFVPHLARLWLACYEEEPIAALMAFAWGERAWYFYGASGDRHREKMPAYALQWTTIRWAKARGCRWYDMWGIPDEDPEILEAHFTARRDGLWGVYRFKRGFGGRIVRWAGAFDRVYSPRLYRLIRRLGLA
ncbi:MAG: peptidoglycan bridge formation glycyltransferase FemA/FemB family protein [Anaerolineae bacterium]|nr:peptidoglycan bridge formation glycyltransferase FemA/FemB family protein [Anaerolineae bacterium]